MRPGSKRVSDLFRGNPNIFVNKEPMQNFKIPSSPLSVRKVKSARECNAYKPKLTCWKISFKQYFYCEKNHLKCKITNVKVNEPSFSNLLMRTIIFFIFCSLVFIKLVGREQSELNDLMLGVLCEGS